MTVTVNIAEVKITNSSRNGIWYENKIGRMFWVIKLKSKRLRVIDYKMSESEIILPAPFLYIRPSDCEILSNLKVETDSIAENFPYEN